MNDIANNETIGMYQLAIEQVPTESLIAYARNARTHSEAQIRELADSMLEFGWTMPCLIDASNVLIAGHGRVLAAALINVKMVPCIRRADLSEAQVRAYRIADNQLATKSGWDMALLQLEVQELAKLDFNMLSLGFEVPLLTSMINGTATAWETDIEGPQADVDSTEENLDGIAAKIAVIAPKELADEVRAAIVELISGRGAAWQTVKIA